MSSEWRVPGLEQSLLKTEIKNRGLQSVNILKSRYFTPAAAFRREVATFGRQTNLIAH